MFKKLISTLIATVMVLSSAQISLAADNTNVMVFENINYGKTPYIRVFLEGKEINFDVNPQSVNGRVMVPMRTIFEEFGLKVDWNQAANTAVATNETMNIVFKLGSKTATVNGVEYPLDTPASIIRGKVMIPLRFLSENMGYNLVWNSDSNIILLSMSNIAEWRYGGYEKTEPYKEYEIKYLNGARTDELRYTGAVHNVKFYNIYTETGKLAQNVPEFHLSTYGKGWLNTSPFVKRTLWVDARLLDSTNGPVSFYNESNGNYLTGQDLLKGSETGNFIKMTIEEHYFDLDSWKKLSKKPVSKLSSAQSTKDLDGEIIMPEDTLFKVTINDSMTATTLGKPVIDLLLSQKADTYNGVLTKNPRNLYNWTNAEWDRLKGDTPWVGMNSNMLIIQKMRTPDQVAKINTKFSKIELWVYEDQYSESIYYIKDGTILSML